VPRPLLHPECAPEPGATRRRAFGDLQQWMPDNNSAVMAVPFWVIGAKLLGNGLSIVLG
jgi:hypothetical protein